MSHIVPLKESIARPGSLLTEHLVNVKAAMSAFFQDDRDSVKVKLIGLAGLCHDIAKNHADWQAYINKKIKKGPNHSDCGAFFFSYIGHYFLQQTAAWDRLKVDWIWLTRDIADHHSQLKNIHDIIDDNCLKKYDWMLLDLRGIEAFFKEQCAELAGLSFDVDQLEKWIGEGDAVFNDVEDELDLGYEDVASYDLMIKLQQWRKLTTSLIAGDRFDVRFISNRKLTDLSDSIVNHIDDYCENLSRDNPLRKVRKLSQAAIMEQMQTHLDDTFYTVDMPTGYGKTMTSLKMAGWFVENKGFTKIVYVAPYLAILEQNSQEIKKATGIVPLEHHSLAIVGQDEQRAEESQLAMESWAHPIVCTSFQQLWRALFPDRAQDVLRRSFLQNSVIIIDEPQIFQADVWNLFLCGLDALADLLQLKVIFLSATMPPFKYGLRTEPTKLQVKAADKNDRYELYTEQKPQDEDSVIQLLKANERDSQAAIFNTIEDAYRVFNALQDERAFLIHGLMLPIHKKMMLNRIKKEVSSKSRRHPLYVISTQILEAGVDMSFQHIARALPILPSIIQAAGRVNRHLEGDEKGRITVFPFFREEIKDTRTCIYNKALQQITDGLLEKQTHWSESQLVGLVQDYYRKMFEENTYESVLSAIRDAAEGRWLDLSCYQPFKNDYMRLPLFIPWTPPENLASVPDDVAFLQDKFRLFNPRDIYARYSDKSFMSNLSFTERKAFMILFHYYVLDIPYKKALKVISQEDYLNKGIPVLEDPDAYDDRLGFRAAYEEFDNII